jgi:hypothetical protein
MVDLSTFRPENPGPFPACITPLKEAESHPLLKKLNEGKILREEEMPAATEEMVDLMRDTRLSVAEVFRLCFLHLNNIHTSLSATKSAEDELNLPKPIKSKFINSITKAREDLEPTVSTFSKDFTQAKEEDLETLRKLGGMKIRWLLHASTTTTPITDLDDLTSIKETGKEMDEAIEEARKIIARGAAAEWSQIRKTFRPHQLRKFSLDSFLRDPELMKHPTDRTSLSREKQLLLSMNVNGISNTLRVIAQNQQALQLRIQACLAIHSDLVEEGRLTIKAIEDLHKRQTELIHLQLQAAMDLAIEEASQEVMTSINAWATEQFPGIVKGSIYQSTNDLKSQKAAIAEQAASQATQTSFPRGEHDNERKVLIEKTTTAAEEALQEFLDNQSWQEALTQEMQKELEVALLKKEPEYMETEIDTARKPLIDPLIAVAETFTLKMFAEAAEQPEALEQLIEDQQIDSIEEQTAQLQASAKQTAKEIIEKELKSRIQQFLREESQKIARDFVERKANEVALEAAQKSVQVVQRENRRLLSLSLGELNLNNWANKNHGKILNQLALNTTRIEIIIEALEKAQTCEGYEIRGGGTVDRRVIINTTLKFLTDHAFSPNTDDKELIQMKNRMLHVIKTGKKY